MQKKPAGKKYGGHSKEGWTFGDIDKDIPNAIRDAILLEHDDIVNYILEKGVNPDNWANVKGTSGFLARPIYFAVLKNNLSLVKQFIKHGAHITAPSRYCFSDDIERNNNTAINTAIEHGFYAIAEYLLKHGASSKECFTLLISTK